MLGLGSLFPMVRGAGGPLQSESCVFRVGEGGRQEIAEGAMGGLRTAVDCSGTAGAVGATGDGKSDVS